MSWFKVMIYDVKGLSSHLVLQTRRVKNYTSVGTDILYSLPLLSTFNFLSDTSHTQYIFRLRFISFKRVRLLFSQFEIWHCRHIEMNRLFMTIMKTATAVCKSKILIQRSLDLLIYANNTRELYRYCQFVHALKTYCDFIIFPVNYKLFRLSS